jgi:hypothetical protein
LGDKEIGVKYLKKLAEFVNGKLDDSYSLWQWCVKKNGKYVSIIEYLKFQEKWVELIAVTLDNINKIEDDKY